MTRAASNGPGARVYITSRKAADVEQAMREDGGIIGCG